jgi:hypothetical protein
MLTLGQAAKETGLSKTAISRAVKNGRLSAQKNEQGEYQIDPAELFRVYPVTVNVDSNVERDATPSDNRGLQGQVELLREIIGRIENERDDLRRRLDNAETAREREAEEREKNAAEIRRLTLALTYDRKPEAAQTETKPSTFGIGWLLVLAFAAAFGVFWYYRF